MKNAVRATVVVAVAIMLVTTAVVVLDVNFLTTSTTSTTSTTYDTDGKVTTAPITKSQSGLVAQDLLGGAMTQQQVMSNQTYWMYGGTAAAQSSSYGLSMTTNQLQIGVASPVAGQWVGYYAVSPPTNATLVNAVLTAPSNAVPGHYSVGLYVQATNQMLNYVACVVATTPTATTWEVIHDHATNTTNGVPVPLWGSSTLGQKLTQDCTIVTNGTNYLKVYLDHVVVYQSNTLNLGMQGPRNFYLETESSSTGALVYGGYQDFYATHGENVTITKAPSNALSAAIVNATGNVLATAPVVSGTATLAMGQYAFPQLAYINLYSSASDTNSSLIASTRSPVSIYGGDIFSVGSNPNPSGTSVLRLNAVDASGNNLTGLAVTLTLNRETVASGYMPIAFTLNDSLSYTITVADFGTYTFSHWGDGSTLRTMTLSVTHDTQLTAFYRTTNTPAPSGMSLLSVAAVNSTGKPLAGFSVSVWQNGTLVATSFMPNTFFLKDGVQYQITVTSFGSYKFDHWGDGVKNAIQLESGSSATPVINLVAVYSGSG